MKISVILAGALLFTAVTLGHAAEVDLADFLSTFDYDTRIEMKMDSKGLVPLLATGKAVLVDIRFKEEAAAWRMGFGLTIPLNELPRRITELPKDRVIVTACPHKDRAIIAMTYLRAQGFEAKYLTDGLIGLAEALRGDRAQYFVEEMGLVIDSAKEP